MTVKLEVPNDTESLIRPLQRTFYPTRIPPQHHQLKNFISTTDPDIIYYASEKEIYALHKSTGKRELIASLPWSPQCLDAAHGWVCVGGPDNGLCAFIFLGDRTDNESIASNTRPSPTEVDALLPLDLDPGSRLPDRQSYLESQRLNRAASRRKPEVHHHELGTSIVNSVTIYRLRSDHTGFRDGETVVLLTNNDQTVRIFSLTQSRVLKRLHFPTPMNHASISPDQELLIAVGDKPQAFFCKRTSVHSPVGRPEDVFASFDWLPIAEPELSLADPQDACFTTAFSPSGHICAVASQSGVITVFDTSLVREDMDTDEAVISVLKSSRGTSRDSMCGAVRSMSFAPAPWDLLAWAEDQGRVCVTDLRHRFNLRQTIELDVDSPDLRRVNMSTHNNEERIAEDRQMEIQARIIMHQREAIAAHNYPAAISHTADYLEATAAQSARRRRILSENQDSTSGALADFSEDSDLTERERHTLDAMIGRNPSRESEGTGTSTSQWSPYSMNYSHSNETTPTAGLPDVDGSLHSPSSTTAAPTGRQDIRDFIRQRSLEQSLDRNRTANRSYQPRRRSSVVVSNNGHTNQSSSSHPSSLAPIGTTTPTLSASPSRLAPTTINNNSSPSANQPMTTFTSGDPWQTITDAMTPANDSHVEMSRPHHEYDEARASSIERRAFHRPSEHLNRHDRLLRNANPQRVRSTQYDYAINPQTLESARALLRDGVLNEDLVMGRIERTSFRHRAEGIYTMGIGWDEQGRKLQVLLHPQGQKVQMLTIWLFRYVATEDGILEYTVNLDGRKTFPGMEFR